MKILDLFSGIGGFALASHKHDFETVAFCEYDVHAQKVLKKRFPNIPIYKDVKKLTKEILDYDGIKTIDIICGGFPCQPFSVAGKQRGQNDDRYLWDEMFRLVKEIHPRWVIGENVSGFVSMALEKVSLDLESEGYEVRSFVIPACAKEARHRRDRVWIVAHANSESKSNVTI